jgi:predicted DsbA family dithiol-disulfide isomerase
MELEVFYDYRCPFVYQAALLIRRVRESGERDLEVGWRYFSLSQANNHEEGWTIWDAAPDDPAAKGRLAFQAAEAARRQERFEPFHQALLEARHEHRRDIDDPHVVEEVAAQAGLDLARFRRDLASPALLEALARDHQEAVNRLGVFGTPTFHVPGRGAAYVRIRPAPEGPAALDLFDQVIDVVAEKPYLLELKRPRPDRPPGEVRPAVEAAAATSSASGR